jgi:hypothetical protein
MVYNGFMRLAVVMLLLFGSSSGLEACTFCAGGFAGRQTLRERAANATMVVQGTLTQSRIGRDGISGETDFRCDHHFKIDDQLGQRPTLTIPQYLPLVGDTPREYLVFANRLKGQPDITGGVLWPSAAVEYAKKAIALPANDPTKRLAFFFGHLESAQPAIAADAFLEFAKASDAEITLAAKAFDAKTVRGWLADPKTPAERIGIYCLLLGLTGDRTDIAWYRGKLGDRDERATATLGGLLAGLTLLDANAGWQEIEAIAIDSRQPFDRRLAALGTMRYLQGSQPGDSKPHLLKIAKPLLNGADFPDVIAEDLRQWKWWDLTAEVLEGFDKPTHAAPIIRQAIVRYALSCPDDRSKAFVAKIRVTHAALVERVEANLKGIAAGTTPGK